ncbi:MAG TPA: MASE3 domain-containing protein [Phycisphaerae bacterium]|nr:MASE3 domain-containing protein [Phycisphaerae bacterium]HRY68087.1 MASE3 domain-containing protein [Phycisphaerae bacterium]HSA29055.1 MASE3 domain-containing protein [Phycisphaerae bacterium]
MTASAEVVAGVRSTQRGGIVIWGLAGLVVLSLTWRSNELLFHSVAGLLAITAAASVFLIAWNSRELGDNGFLLFLGTAYLGIASLDVLNTLSHPGLGVFAGYPDDMYRQLRVASSGLNGCALLIAPCFLRSRLRPWTLLLAIGAVVAVILVLIFGLRVFPYCGPANSGGVSFRQVSVLVILAMLGGAMLHVRRSRKRLDGRFRRSFAAAVLVALGAEVCFAIIDSVTTETGRTWAPAGFFGHVLRIGSYCLVCGAVIESGLRKPFGILFRRLKESEERLRYIIKYDPSAIAVYDKDLRYLYVSDRYLRDYRIERETIIGLHCHDVFPELSRRWGDAHQRCLSGHIECSEEDELVHSDGSVDYVRWEFRPWQDAQGQIGGMIAYTEVITERRLAEQKLRESEKRYRGLFSSMREGFALHEIICDTGGVPVDYRFLEVNEAFESITGLKVAETIGKTVLEVLPHTDPYWIDTYGRVALTGQPVSFEHAASDLGKYFQVTAFSPKPGQFATIFLDITDRKRAEEELNRYQLHLKELVERRTRELEESRKHLRRHERLASIGTLVAGIAHEINNPIGGVLLAAQNVQRLAARPEHAAAVDACVRDIVQSAERCREIIRNLMNFAGQRPTRKTPGDVNACVHRSAQLTEQYIRDLGGTLKLELAEHLPHVPLNPLAVEQALVNLMRNAAESGNKGLLVTVRTELTDRSVRVTVSDNGRGISDEQLKHVFDPFFTTRLARGGTGLGLSIVHGIITEQGGIIDVHSRLGSGTTLTIDLPLAIRDPGEEGHGQGPCC